SGSGSGSGSASGSASGTEEASLCVYDSGSPGSGSPAATVEIALDEFSISVDGEVPVGVVTFEAVNEGEEDHEVVIAQSDTADLPTDDDGAADESQLPAGALLGEIEAFPAGESHACDFELEPGSYVLFCNVVEEEEGGEIEAHFSEGMVTTIEVG
ncbi:MAG: hypothetical protein ACRD0U_03645, partial [Acidimicrobiales bacterium]